MVYTTMLHHDAPELATFGTAPFLAQRKLDARQHLRVVTVRSWKARFTERRVVVTNKTPIGAYRGYGQPEVNFAYERMMDKLGRRLGIDRVELRALNMVRPE